MLSTAYRQLLRDPAQAALDSDNRYYGRQNVVRLDVEALRDRVLAASGTLDRTLFGPPVAVKEDDAGQVIVAGDVQRRSLYAMQSRSQPSALMQAFEAPAMQTNCEARSSSTVATQSLMLMNGDFWLTQAGARRSSGARAGKKSQARSHRRPRAKLESRPAAVAIRLSGPTRSGARRPSRRLRTGPDPVGKAAPNCPTSRPAGSRCMPRAVIRANTRGTPRSGVGPRRPTARSPCAARSAIRAKMATV